MVEKPADTIPDDLQALRRCIRDLFSLSALPAIWMNYDLPRGLQNLADVLWSALRAQIVYIRMASHGRHSTEVVCTGYRTNSDADLRLISNALKTHLNDRDLDAPIAFTDPRDQAVLSMMVKPILYEGEERGVVMVGSRLASFPTNSDSLLTSAAVTQAAILFQRHTADHTLRESELRYRLIGEATNDAVWDWDLQSDVVQWNQAVSVLFGYAVQDVQPHARWWKEHLHPEDRQRVVDGIQAAIHGGAERWSDEYRYERRDGSYAYVLDRGAILRDAAGSPYRMVGAMLDLSDRRRAEEKISTLNRALTEKLQAYEKAMQELEKSRAELEEKNQELEKFHDAVVGRELKMIELEKELEKHTTTKDNAPPLFNARSGPAN
jgi:PAS domain S-box-containing protein